LLATASVWAGIAISYAAPTLPVSFTIMTVAAALYASSFLRRTRPAPAPWQAQASVM
jgi:zinc/manganese transport system permease protein